MPSVAIIFGKSRVVLRHQQAWAIARKELVSALVASELLKQAVDSLRLPEVKQFLWSDSTSVLSWIKNPELRLDKFISRRVHRILLLSEPDEWNYCPTDSNPADVASRPDSVKKACSRDLWFQGPEFLREVRQIPLIENRNFSVNRVSCPQNEIAIESAEDKGLDKLIECAPSLYVLKKRVAYLLAFVQYLHCRSKRETFVKPVLDPSCLDRALYTIVGYVQRKFYGEALRMMKGESPEALSETIERCVTNNSRKDKQWVKELRGLKKYRPCIGYDGLMRIEGRLENSPELDRDTNTLLLSPVSVL